VDRLFLMYSRCRSDHLLTQCDPIFWLFLDRKLGVDRGLEGAARFVRTVRIVLAIIDLFARRLNESSLSTIWQMTIISS
jgi:hypothetical protein